MTLTPESVARWERQLCALREDGLRPGRSVHLVGVGGIGMAGIALHLQARGLQVSGSELTPGRVTEWLEGHGIAVKTGHAAAYVGSGVDWVIKTPAVDDTNSEIARAVELGIPVVTRGVVLPALLDGTRSVAVAGTHGKTTTSSMVAQILAHAGHDPSHCIGGEIDRLGGVAGVGTGSCMVVEADESDGTLVLYEPEIGLLTNVEYDHMEHFGSEQEFIGCFHRFTGQCDHLMYCVDDPVARDLGAPIPSATGYGKGPGAQVTYRDYRPDGQGSHFQLQLPETPPSPVRMRVPGEHQACNATGAAAVAWKLGVEAAKIVAGLESFIPARRRYEVTVQDPAFTVVSDYAHHPTEIRAVVQAARERHPGRILAVFQPHRFTRTRALLDDFPGAFAGIDELILVPVYAASESPLDGGTSADLLAATRKAGTVSVELVDSLDAAWHHLQSCRRPGDLLLVVGAGDVEQLAHRTWGEAHLPR